MSVHRHNFTGLRVSGAFATLACPDFECTEPAKLDDLILTQAAFHFFEKLIENIVNVLAIDPKFFVDVLDDFGFRQFAVRQIGPSV